MVTGLPFYDPPLLNTSSPPNLHLRLVAEPTRFDLAGRQVWGNSYNGSFVGPTMQLEPGQHVTVTLVNKLSSPTNLHYHGMEISPEGTADNPFLTDPPGATLTYHFDIPLDHPQGTFWYHDHQMCMGPQSMLMPGMSTSSSSSSSCLNVESQIFSGLSGTILVGDDRTLLPARLRHITAHTLVFKDVQIGNSGHIIEDAGRELIDMGNPTVRLVNGQLRPVLSMRPGETQLWRLANEGADIFYDLSLGGYRFTVVGQDGVPVHEITTVQTLLLPPGKRYDVLVSAGPHSGTSWLRTLAWQDGPGGASFPEVALMKLQVGGTAVRPVAMPAGAMPTAPASLANAPIAQRRNVVLSENTSGTKMYINGQQFNPNKPTFSTPAVSGTVEQWTVYNLTGQIHPFHIHVSHFQVMSVNGVSQPYIGMQDIVDVPVGGAVVIRIAFTFPGRWMFHCHIEAHADAGMMGWINVVPARMAS